MTKKFNFPKLALELIGYLITSIVIASFSFCFLYFISISIGEKAIENGFYDSSTISDPEFLYWLQLICILATIIIFFTFFLLFLGQKISYILSITNAIQILKEGDLSFKIDSIGNDELTDLADTINSFSMALKNYRENEERLKKEKDELIRSLSHDIRTPLTAIISYSDFIKDKKYNSPEKLNSYIEIIQNKAYQIQDLSSLLLNPNSTQDKSSDNSLLDGKLLFEQFISEFTDALEDNDFKIDLDKLGLINFKTKVNVQ
ncbi:HAMP domain-containing sensor histidine kinase, partial [Clostridium sp.]|uniref:sensor histidine kinase n=1 Tax=Clostridium sp. TaxID=1506 RepID=UPI003F2D31FD